MASVMGTMRKKFLSLQQEEDEGGEKNKNNNNVEASKTCKRKEI